MSANPYTDPVAPPRPVTPGAAALAHDARGALTVAHARLQMLHRRTDQGAVDCAAFLVELDEACLAIRRAVALVDALEATAAVLPLLAAPPSPERRPDD